MLTIHIILSTVVIFTLHIWLLPLKELIFYCLILYNSYLRDKIASPSYHLKVASEALQSFNLFIFLITTIQHTTLLILLKYWHPEVLNNSCVRGHSVLSLRLAISASVHALLGFIGIKRLSSRTMHTD